MAEKRAESEETGEPLVVVPPGAVKGGSGDLSVSASDSVTADAEITDAHISAADDQASSQQTAGEDQAPKPKQEPLFEVDGTRVYVSLTNDKRKQRFVPATGIVVPVGVEGGVYGSYAQSLKKELRPETWGRIEGKIKDAASSGIQVDRPAPIVLEADIVREVLPNTPLANDDDIGYIIAASSGGTEEPEELLTAAERIVSLAAERRISHLTILPLGTGRGQFKERVDEVAAQMTTGIWVALNELPTGSLAEITMATRDKDFVNAAKDKARVLARNRPQAIQNDEPAAEDLIGIRFEAEALAETVLLQDTEVPLAVGILGGWGSGKSTVMRLMQKKMTDIRVQPVSSEDESSKHVGHVYQIRFNAWTYAKANLWASLMQTIFTEMNQQLSREQCFAKIKKELGDSPVDSGVEYQYLYDEYGWSNPGAWKTVHKEIREKLQSWQVSNQLWKTLTSQQKEKLEKLRKKQKDIAIVRKDHEEEKIEQRRKLTEDLESEAQKKALVEFERKAATILGKTTEEIVTDFVRSTDAEASTQMEEILTGMQSIRTSWNQVWRLVEQKRSMAIPIIALCLIIIFGTVTITFLLDFSTFEKILSAAISLIPLLLATIRATTPLARQVGELATEYTQLEKAEMKRLLPLQALKMAERRAKDEEKVQRIMLSADSTNEEKLEELQEMKTNLVAYEYREQILEAEIEALRQEIGPPAQYDSLLDFVQARLDEKAYEKELGLMHRVRRDLDILTDGLVIGELDGATLIAKKSELFPRGPARVVLFIDDLDRCPPKRVVEVFEAVQLLLSTELFVVVLGLDTRYVTKALEEAYKHILKAGGDPSGLDYIEKIIQIPYRVRGIGPGGVGRLLTKLMGEIHEERPTVEETRPLGPEPTSAAEQRGQANGQGKAEGDDDSSENKTETLRFLLGDRNDLELCCQQLQLTPRSIKRMVNVLRLLVVYWIRRLGHQYGTEANRPIKRAVIGLLALAAAYPEIMREIFVELDVSSQAPAQSAKKPIGNLLTEFAQQSKLPFLPEWQLERFSSDVEALQNVPFENEKGQREPVSFFGLALEDLGQDNLNLVRSFSFVGDPTHSLDGDAPGSENSNLVSNNL